MAPARIALTPAEMIVLDKMTEKNDTTPETPCLSDYLIKIAKRGGYLARRSDAPPGSTVMWRGLSRMEVVGN